MEPEQESSAEVCLCMIVKDEAHVMKRCIESARPFIDAWCIVDTGSKDGTQEVIKACLSDMPGKLFERPWQDFAKNRTQALVLSKGFGRYALVIDADDVLVLEDVEKAKRHIQETQHGVYEMAVEYFSLRYKRPHVFDLRLPWRYSGVIHEYAECPGQTMFASEIPGVHYKVLGGGGRSKSNPGVSKAKKDIEVLRQALKNPSEAANHARYAFYLGQTHWDIGEWTESRAQYKRRTRMSGSIEEGFIARYRVAQCSEKLGDPPAKVMTEFLEAWESRPSRIEPLVTLAAYFRSKDRFEMAAMFARQACLAPFPEADRLFVDRRLYDVGRWDELSIACHYLGKVSEAQEAFLKIPPQVVVAEPRLIDNARFILGADWASRLGFASQVAG